ncbi:hypothetical protein Avbf_15077 [Armadillidium vulgare]|nr:hypothetical protein Avbf_15077 [Armadillidium vulgare]
MIFLKCLINLYNIYDLIRTIDVRSPSTLEQRRFSYDSGIYNNGNHHHVTVVRGNSPSVIECAVEDTRRRKRITIPVILMLIVLLVLAIIGILGVIASKTLPKPNSYCLGEHFCIPLNLSAIKERAEAEAAMQDKSKDVNDKRRTLLPRLIPRVIGKIDISSEREDKSKVPEDKMIKTDSDVMHSRPRSLFMPREEDKVKEAYMRQREWNNQWDNRRLSAPPGVNPKVYWRNEEL